MAYQVLGQKKLMRKLAKFAPKTFSATLRNAALKGHRELVSKTPIQTGHTARNWKFIPKHLLEYHVVNNQITADKKHSIIEILDKGRKEVRPIRAKRLYIPLSNKGRSKGLGAPIPKGLKFGIDYVLAQKAKATTGKKFMEGIIRASTRDVVRDIISKIRRI